MSTVVEEVDTWTFFLVDPFDKTYNPAKQIRKNSPLEYSFYNSLE